MISLLSKWLIPNHEDPTSPAVRQAYGRLCGWMGVALNLLLFFGKFFAGLLSNSVAVMADAFNNLSDAGSSVVTLLGFRLASRKPDPEHPFGHGRMEYVSGLVVAGLILLMGMELAQSSLDKILHPSPVAFSPVALVILMVSVAAKLYMFLYNRQIGRKIHSTAMAATAMDSVSDAISTLAVLAAMLLGHFTDLMLDGWMGMIVALFILFSAYRAAKETLDPLLGQPPEREFVERIEQIVLAHDGICGIHDLMVHNYGPGRLIISLHAEVPADRSVLEIHDLIDNIEQELGSTLNCEAVIHMDPILTDDEATNALRQQVAELVKQVDETFWNHFVKK